MLHPSIQHLLTTTAGTSPTYTTTAGSGKESILLRGGFSFPQHSDSTLYSPTLQINGDLADFSKDGLQALATAEYLRLSAVNYRSYREEIDLQLTIIGSSAKTLSRFIAIYGGILDCLPLLSKGYHADFITAEKLHISSRDGKTTLSYITKTPIEQNRCDYCGLCGATCPEQCLSEKLFLDFSRCSSCRECEAICPHDAIDIHCAEKQQLYPSALLILDEAVQIDLPEKEEEEQKNIFGMQDLPQYLSTLFASRIDEVVTCKKSVCHYSGRFNIGCTRCFSVCPVNAISLQADGIQIDQHRCTECGRCLAICPTGAMDFQRFSDREFIDYFSRLKLTPGTTVVIANEDALHTFWWQQRTRSFANTFFLEYPQVQALSSMHLLYLYAIGAGKILLIPQQTDGDVPENEQYHFSNTILWQVFGEEQRIQYTSINSLPDLLQESAGTPLTEPYQPGKFENRRQMLTSLLHFFQKTKNCDLYLDSPPFSTFGDITCDTDRCTTCLACLSVCKTRALTTDATQMALIHHPALCIQCVACCTICPEDVLQLWPGLRLDSHFNTPVTLNTAEPIHCLECGKIFGTRQSYKRVMTIIKKQQPENDSLDLLGYCEDCRVIKLFETTQ